MHRWPESCSNRGLAPLSWRRSFDSLTQENRSLRAPCRISKCCVGLSENSAPYSGTTREAFDNASAPSRGIAIAMFPAKDESSTSDCGRVAPRRGGIRARRRRAAVRRPSRACMVSLLVATYACLCTQLKALNLACGGLGKTAAKFDPAWILVGRNPRLDMRLQLVS